MFNPSTPIEVLLVLDDVSYSYKYKRSRIIIDDLIVYYFTFYVFDKEFSFFCRSLNNENNITYSLEFLLNSYDFTSKDDLLDRLIKDFKFDELTENQSKVVVSIVEYLFYSSFKYDCDEYYHWDM